MESRSRGRDWTIRESLSRSPSPPPPPPPPMDSSSIIYAPFDEEPVQNRSNSPSKSTRTGPFPFLKKNSRKEPSAIHKKSPSPAKKSKIDSSEKKPANSGGKFGNNIGQEKALDKFDVLLSGKDYWGLDNSIVDDIRAEINNQGSGLSSQKDSSDNISNKMKSAEYCSQQKQQMDNELAEFEKLENAISQGSLHTKLNQKGPEFHLAKVLSKSNSTTSPFVKMAQASSALSHSRLLAQTLARSKSTEERKSTGASSSVFGYKRDKDDDDNDDEAVDSLHGRFGMTNNMRQSAGVMSKEGSMSQRPASIPTNATYADDNDDIDIDDDIYNHNDNHFRLEDKVTHTQQIKEDNHTDLSFDFEDLPLPSVTAGKSYVPQPPYATYTTSNQTPQHQRNNNNVNNTATTSNLERPASTLTVDHPSATAGHQARTRSPVNATQQRRNRSLSAGRDRGICKTTSSASVVSQTTSDMPKEMEEKMHSLEKELDHYKAENASIKKLKKQQELALAEIVQRKEEVLRYLEEERQRTLAWCAEQRAEAEKEKRTAAKQIREAKQKTLGTTAPVKVQKAEIEALQATIEKLKSSHELAIKKWKTTENRLYALIHEHSDHVENLEKQLLVLEDNRISLLEFIAQAGLRLPKLLQDKMTSDLSNPVNVAKSAKALPSKTGNTSSSNAATNTTKGGRVSAAAARQQALQQTLQKIQLQQEKEAHKGYIEEVDVEVVKISSPIIPTNKAQQSQSSVSNNSNPTTRRSSTSSNTTTTSSSSLAGRQLQQRQHNHSGLPGATLGLSVNENAMRQMTSSWARSSRSSGRYSQTSDDLEDFFEDDEDGIHRPTNANNLDRYNQSADLLVFDGESDVKNLYNINNNTSSNGTSNCGMEYTRHAIDNAFADLLPATATPSLLTAASISSSSAIPLKQSSSGGNISDSNNNHRTEEVRPDGTKIIRYRNGTIKEIDLAGNQKVYFANGDRKFTDIQSNTIIYFYAENQTSHTTYADGVELLEFPNGQLERHYPSGKKEVVFPDRSKKIIHSDGLQESIFPDGVRLLEYSDGRREVLRPSDVNEVY